MWSSILLRFYYLYIVRFQIPFIQYADFYHLRFFLDVKANSVLSAVEFPVKTFYKTLKKNFDKTLKVLVKKLKQKVFFTIFFEKASQM